MWFIIQHKESGIGYSGPDGTIYGLNIKKFIHPPGDDYQMIYNETRYSKKCDATLHPMAKPVPKLSAGWDFSEDYGIHVCPHSPVNELIFTEC
jgi:hypothetical protein